MTGVIVPRAIVIVPTISGLRSACDWIARHSAHRDGFCEHWDVIQDEATAVVVKERPSHVPKVW